MTSRLRDTKLIYECFVEVNKPTSTAEALITNVYPKDYEWEEDTKKQLPKFTFPTRTSNETEEHFTFVLTDLDGNLRFGFCRYPPKGETCLCFLSDLPWFKVFYRSLDKISDLRLDHQHELVEPFLAGLRSHPMPTLTMETVLSVVPEGVDTGQVYTFPLPNPKRLPEIPTDDNFTQFYTNLHYNVILHLFANLIFERRIIITSSSLSLLSATVHGVVSLIYPLHWQHIFIPITPPHLLDYCAAPMPFLMGIHSSYMDLVRKMPIEDVVLLDVDESAMESPHVEDLVALPTEVVSELKHVLKKQTSAYGETVARSFLRAQVSMIGGYRSALKLRHGEKEVVFDEEQFLHSRPNSEEFLEKLLHFQHFRQFMNNKVDKLKTRALERDRFDEEVMMYEESKDRNKVAFEKFISSTLKVGEQIKERSEKIGRRMRKQAKIVWKKLDKAGTDKYYSGYTMPHGKTHSLPVHKSASESLIPRHTVLTPPPLGGGSKVLQPRKPPTVIPYHRHKEGKEKLEHILKLQNSGFYSDRPNVGTLIAFTPPGTPRSVASGDQSERVSLDSRGSTDLSGEIAVGHLIDISSSPTVDQGTAVVLPQSDSSDTNSVSSASSSDNNESDLPVRPKQQWETFDDLDTQPLNTPPLPPPRAELEEAPHDKENVSATLVDVPVDSPPKSTNPFRDFDYESNEGQSELSFNLVESDLDGGNERQKEPSPFESLHLSTRPRSPFDDFSSSVGQALLNNSENSNDPSAATTLVDTGQQLATVEEEEEADEGKKEEKKEVNENGVILANPSASANEAKLPEPLVPTTTTSGDSTHNALTALPRSPLRKDSGGANLSSAVASAHGFHSSYSAPTFHQHQFQASGSYPNYYAPHTATNPFYSYGYQHMTYDSRHLKRPSGPRSPKYAQDIQLSLPQVPLNLQKSKRSPPPKPQPYSRPQVTDKTDEDDPMLMQRLPSIGEFNFDSLLGEGGMEGYVKSSVKQGSS